MKKPYLLILAALMLAMTLMGCDKNDAQPDAGASQPSEQERAVTISEQWHGTYHSTDGEKEIVLTVTGTGGTVEIDGASSELTAKAEHDREIQLVDGDGSVVHLTVLSDNPIDKRYAFAVTAKDDPATQIIGNTFMQRDGDAAAPIQPTDGSDNQNDDAPIDDAGVFPFIGITYKAQEYDGVLIFQKPDEEGYPTEIVIDGDTYTLEGFSITYDPSLDTWTGGAAGNGASGSIGISVSGNNEKWMLWVSGALNMTSAYYGDDAQGNDGASTDVSSYSFIGKVYKNEDIDLTFKLQTPDANGCPTEIVLDGETYFDDIRFSAETILIEYTSVASDDQNNLTIQGSFIVEGVEYELHLYGNDDGWRVYGPGLMSGDYYPQ
jgi:hypothetical protein